MIVQLQIQFLWRLFSFYLILCVSIEFSVLNWSVEDYQSKEKRKIKQTKSKRDCIPFHIPFVEITKIVIQRFFHKNWKFNWTEEKKKGFVCFYHIIFLLSFQQRYMYEGKSKCSYRQEFSPSTAQYSQQIFFWNRKTYGKSNSTELKCSWKSPSNTLFLKRSWFILSIV